MTSKVAIMRYLVFLLPVFTLQQVFGQKNLNFTCLSTKNGLSSNTINVILQDHNNLMWFGTSDGLNKFDGTNFTAYNHIDGDSTSIPGNEIISLLEDHTGKLWVGTAEGNLAYYDSWHNAFVPCTIQVAGRPIAIWNTRALYEDRSGKIWAGGYGKITTFDPKTKTGEIIDISKFFRSSDILAVLSFFEDNKGQMWVGTSIGVLRIDKKSKGIISFIHNASDPESLSGNDIRTIIQDRRGHLFFGTNDGLDMLLPNGKGFKVYHHNDRDPASIANDVVYSAIVAPDGNLWLGTEDGISLFNPATGVSSNIRPNRRKSFSLSHKSIRCIYLAQRGITWLGTYQGGVNKYDPNLALFNVKRANPFDPQGLTSPAVTSFAEYKTGKIFIGTDGGGLHLFDRNTGLFEHVDIKSKISASNNPLPVLAMDVDSENKLWVGTFQNGLFVFDPITHRYKQYLAGPTNHDLSQNDIFFIKKDTRGRMWIGTNGRGVDVFDPKTQNFLRYNKVVKNKNDVLLPLNGYMRAMAEDHEGNIWLGSVGTGIAMLNPVTNNIKIYNTNN